MKVVQCELAVARDVLMIQNTALEENTSASTCTNWTDEHPRAPAGHCQIVVRHQGFNGHRLVWELWCGGDQSSQSTNSMQQGGEDNGEMVVAANREQIHLFHVLYIHAVSIVN
jgi:hypothetical protein